MDKKILLISAVAVSQIGGCNKTLAAEKTKQEKIRPNFLLLLTDDQSYHLSLIGTPGIQTPNMDYLAKQGVFFTKAYAAAASCSPCRSSILTGMYPHSNGHWRNTVTPVMTDPDVQFGRNSTKVDKVGVHEDLPTLIEILNKNGYITGITEKFHLSPPWKFPFNYHYPANMAPESQYKAAISFFKKSINNPFFLEVNIGNTHRPWRAHIKQAGLPEVSPNKVQIPPNWPDTEITREDYAEYLSTVEHADAVIGEVLKALNESGQAENTIIIFTSDQGFCYHRAKASTYDWGVHIPLSFTGPGIAKSILTPELVSHVDVTPTVLDFAGISIPSNVQGKSLRLMLKGKTKTSGESFVFSEHNAHGPSPEEYYPTRTVTDGHFRYIRNLRNQIVPDYPIERFVTDPVWANKPKGLAWMCWDATSGGPWDNHAFAEIIKNKEKFPVQYNLLRATFFRPKEELYDLVNDPYEMKNLAGLPEYKLTLDRLSKT
ncbi:MAG: sulfatase, partial [Bacteroidetes bacterium]|nr:sulfatase [Bacteroidota bacterium]